MKLINTPRSLDLEITNRCNLRCKYCSHFSSPDACLKQFLSDGGRLPDESVRNIRKEVFHRFLYILWYKLLAHMGN